MASTVSWFSDPDSVLSVLRQDSEERVRMPRLAGYDVLRELGRGGQGVVYLATQRSTKRSVALKVLIDGVYASAASRRRFDRELDVIVGLHHQGIVQIHDSGVTSDDRPFIVMEYIEGVRLDRYVAEHRGSAGGAVSIRERLALFATICDAIAYAHQRGVIHRDLKPGNILIDETGAPHICDFGLAKSAIEATGEALSVTNTSMPGRFLGTLPWAAPEQFEANAAQADVRRDVYALGVILFQMLTDRFPYDVAGGMREVIDNILHAAPSKPSNIASGLDDDVDTIVLKCLAKDAAGRYQSAAELARDVRHYLAGEPIEAKRDSAWYTLGKTLRRYRAIIGAAGVATILLTAALVVSLWSWRDAAQARDETAAESAQRAAIDGFLQRMLTSVEPGRDGRDVRLIEVIDRAAAELPTTMKGQPRVEAQIRARLASSYTALGMYERAEQQLRTADEMTSREYGPQSPEALEIRSRLPGPLVALGRLEDAESVSRAAVDDLRRVAGEHDPRTLFAMERLGHVLNERGRTTEAEAILRAVLDDQRRILGDGYEDTLTTMDELAVLLRRAGRFEESETIFREALDREIQQNGPENPGTLSIQSNLALALQSLGKLDESEALHRRTVESRQRVLGEDHPDTLASMSNFATLLLDRHKPDEAVAILRPAVEHYTQTLGEENPATLTAMNNLAKALQDVNQLAEAEPLFRRALDARRRVFGPDHALTLLSAGNLASLLVLQGHMDEAVKLHEQVLASRRRTLGNENFDTLVSMNNVAMLMQKAGRFDKAEALFREAVEAASKILPPNHFVIGLFRGNLGRCLVALERLDDAEPEFEAAIQILEAAFGLADARTMQNVNSLVDVLDRTGQKDKAAGWRERIGASRDKAAGRPTSSH